jgi:leucyl/phenylalanyl-tRNA---protein transferase
VVRGCARAEDPGTGTWITPEMMSAYGAAARLGHAHSVEVWAGRRAWSAGSTAWRSGGHFFAESMFSRRPNASKAAMIFLAEALRARDFLVMDCQLPSPHLATMGAREIPRQEFLALVSRSIGEHAPAVLVVAGERQPVRVPASANS